MKTKCIYCSKEFDPSCGEGDHIIPAGLGEFRGDKRFRRICSNCNNRIGRSEQQLLQCGPESFFRSIVRPSSKRLRKRGVGRTSAVMGAPTPEFTMNLGDHSALVRPSTDAPQNAFPVDQVVIRDEKDHEYAIRLFPRMRPEQLEREMRRRGVGTMKCAWLNCDERQGDEYRSLLAQVWPKSKYEDLPPMEAGVHKIPIRIKLTVTNHYFRALAKIAFHYYLQHCRRGYHGDEPNFVEIRNFIMNGGNEDRLFRTSGRKFVLPFGNGLYPSQWCHILGADETDGVIVGYVRMFVGPGALPQPHYITLGKIESKVICPSFMWGHVYFYDDGSSSGRYAGHVEEASVTAFPPS